MPGPRRTLGEYVTDRIHEFGTLGGVVRMIRVLEIADDDATLHATITFGDGDAAGVFVAFEHMRIEDGVPHRFKYSYQASIGTDFLFRYDRDPAGHPKLVEHKHVAGRDDRLASERMTLHAAAEELWAAIADRDEEMSGRVETDA